MFNKPLVTVIIPIYNSGTFIDETLRSVRNQSYKNLQILVIDDGSTDDSLDKVINQRNLDSRVEIIVQMHKGVATARNVGVDNAVGEYITFVDSDDSVHMDYVLNLVEPFLKYEDLLYSSVGFNKVHSETEKFSFGDDKYSRKEILNIDNATLLFLGPNKHFDVSVWGKLFPSELLHKMPFIENVYFEDFDLISRMLRKSKTEKIFVDRSIRYHYFQRMNTVSRLEFDRSNVAALKIANDMDFSSISDPNIRAVYVYKYTLAIFNIYINAYKVGDVEARNELNRQIISILTVSKVAEIRYLKLFVMRMMLFLGERGFSIFTLFRKE